MPQIHKAGFKRGNVLNVEMVNASEASLLLPHHPQVKAQAGSHGGITGLGAQMTTFKQQAGGTVLYQSSAMMAQAAYDASLANSMAR
jgi:hypothetical protein